MVPTKRMTCEATLYASVICRPFPKKRIVINIGQFETCLIKQKGNDTVQIKGNMSRTLKTGIVSGRWTCLLTQEGWATSEYLATTDAYIKGTMESGQVFYSERVKSSAVSLA